LNWVDVGWSILMLGVGIVAGWRVAVRLARYRLDVIILQDVVLFAGIDSDVRAALSVSYRDSEVDDLTIVELMVANRGSNPLESPIRPLEIRADNVDSSWDLLDVSISGASRDDLGVHISDGEVPHVKRVHFDFLNPNDYILLKVLLSGEYSSKVLSVQLSSPHLPHELPLVERRALRPKFENTTSLMKIASMLLVMVPVLIAMRLDTSPWIRVSALLVGGLLWFLAMWLVTLLEKAIRARDPLYEVVATRRERERAHRPR